MPKNLKSVAAFEDRRLFEIFGNADKKLVEQKHAENTGPGGNNQGQRAIQPAQLIENEIHGNQHDLTGHH